MENPERGFREVEHTADWELEAWAPDLVGLLEQSARGMYTLSGTHLQTGPRLEREFRITWTDPEILLVKFLSELLYLSEQENLAFDRFEFKLETGSLAVRVAGAPVATQDKEIKAVTYHNLAVRQTPRGLAVNLVFDV
jgi:SHS2 domain-containing protein